MKATLLERVARMSQTARTVREQAHAMGMKATHYLLLREEARRAGFAIPAERTVHRGKASPRFAAVLAQMEGPPCPFDGLHGFHECTANRRAEDFMIRVSPGLVETPVIGLARRAVGG